MSSLSAAPKLKRKTGFKLKSRVILTQHTDLERSGEGGVRDPRGQELCNQWNGHQLLEED